MRLTMQLSNARMPIACAERGVVQPVDVLRDEMRDVAAPK